MNSRRRPKVRKQIDLSFASRVLKKRKIEEKKRQEEIEREHLLEYRKVLEEGKGQSQDSYDKALMTLSGGAIAISFSFADKFVKGSTPVAYGLLTWAWIFWGSSLVAILLSFAASSLANEETRKVLDAEYDKEGSPIDWAKITNVAENGLWTNFVVWSNVFSGLFLISGMAFIIAFAHLNLEKMGKIDGKKAAAVSESEGR